MIRNACTAVVLLALLTWAWCYPRHDQRLPKGRQEVRFWHFWGGEERHVVDDVVRRFNSSQSRYWVRSVAMPGTNLDVKLFLAVTGGRPPDLVNQDDPILADWAMRNAISPISQVASVRELAALRRWMLPAAWQLGCVAGTPFALCNGLDVRALYYNATLLRESGLAVPETIEELDRVASQLVERTSMSEGHSPAYRRLGFLPNPRNLWSWGIVFGGDFFDEERFQPTANDPAIVAALEWMSAYGRRFGPSAAAFRQRDQSLPGKSFPLLADRYAMIVDGQWRCRDITRANREQLASGRPAVEFAVAPLPKPTGGRSDAGWINGNFFVIPHGASQAAGAWEFMKFWSGFGGYEAHAARTSAAGYWIPVSQSVAKEETFQRFLAENPLFREFVRLAGSVHQVPRPQIPAAVFYDREITHAASEAIFRAHERVSKNVLDSVQARMEVQLRLRQATWSRFIDRLHATQVPTRQAR